ncbi:unnamed protein product [Caretta caretta]
MLARWAAVYPTLQQAYGIEMGWISAKARGVRSRGHAQQQADVGGNGFAMGSHTLLVTAALRRMATQMVFLEPGGTGSEQEKGEDAEVHKMKSPVTLQLDSSGNMI